MSPEHWRKSAYFLLVAVLVCGSSVVAQSEKQRDARVNLGGTDVERLITSITELKVMDTKHQKLEASSFRDVQISGSEVPFNFTARYRNYQEIPVPKLKRVERRILGERVVVDLPDGVRMELRELLDVSGTVNAKLVLKNVGDKVELGVEIVDIPIKGVPKELRELIVGEVKKQVDRTLFSQSTYLPAYDAKIAITLAQPLGSSTYFEAAPATILHAFEQALEGDKKLLERHHLKFETDPQTKQNCLLVKTDRLLQTRGKDPVSLEDAKLYFPEIAVRDEVINLRLRLSFSKLVHKAKEYPGGTVNFHVPLKLVEHSDAEFGLQLGENARDISFLEADKAVLDMLSQTLNAEYGPELEALLKSLKIKKSDLDIPLPSGLPTKLSRLAAKRVKLVEGKFRLEYSLE